MACKAPVCWSNTQHKSSISKSNKYFVQHWEDGSVVSITGRNFWLIGITLAESSLASLEYNWLWSGMLNFIAIFIIIIPL